MRRRARGFPSCGARRGPRRNAPVLKPPAAKAPPPFALRLAAPPDEPFLLRLYAATRTEELDRGGWSEAQREEFIRGQFRARQAHYAARFMGAEASVIVAAGEDAGACTLWRGREEIRLVNIELLPRFRGRGIGSALLRQWAVEARAARLPLVLSVRDDNLAALRLYQRHGFRVHARADGYLSLRNDR